MDPKPVKDSITYISLVMGATDANTLGNVHGGVIMRQIDNAAGVAAQRHSRMSAVTAAIDQLDFHNPCFIGDVLTLKASVNLTGRTSIEVGVRADSENPSTGETRHIASAYLTFVALDQNRKPAPVPPVLAETEKEKYRYKAAEDRRDVRALARKLKQARADAK